jgi:hypothetical protein
VSMAGPGPKAVPGKSEGTPQRSPCSGHPQMSAAFQVASVLAETIFRLS